MVEINNLIHELVENRKFVEFLSKRHISIENILKLDEEGSKHLRSYRCFNKCNEIPKDNESLDSICNTINFLRSNTNMLELRDKITNEYCIKYFVQEWSETSKKVIENFSDTNTLFRILGRLFCNISGTKEDVNLTKSILFSIQIHGIKDAFFDYLIEGISAHINRSNKEIVERGFIVATVLFNTNDFKIYNFNQSKSFLEFIPKSLLEIQEVPKEKWREDDFKIDKSECIRVENEVILEKQTKVRHLQEAIKLIKEEKDEVLEDVYRNLSTLINEASDRLLKTKSKEYFWIILFYDEFDEYKIESLCILTRRCYSLLIDDLIESLFRNDVGLRFKVIVINILLYLVEKCEISKIKEINEKLSFRLKVNDSFIHQIVRSNLEFLFRIIFSKL